MLQPQDRDRTVAELRERLLAAANPAGGWGYYTGKSSRVEPTVWALRALLAGGSGGAVDFRPHVRFLDACRTGEGLLREPNSVVANLAANGQAALLLQDSQEVDDAGLLDGLVDALLATRAKALPASEFQRQDNSLIGWPWVEGTFSWAEPTSWCVLALKRLAARASGPAAAERFPDLAGRVVEGEAVLFDRCCESGGWNYGNSNVLGTSLHPYVPTTALALIALQDRRDHPAVERSLEYLRRHWSDEPSGVSLGLTLVCLRALGVAADEVEARLAAQMEATGFFGNLHASAVALYGLSAQDDGYRAFRL